MGGTRKRFFLIGLVKTDVLTCYFFILMRYATISAISGFEK